MEQVIGIDLSKRVFQLNIVSSTGKPIQNKMVSREKLTLSLPNKRHQG
ncbi:hypothetical protein [Xenorhabdus hominickii]|uniref:Transposase n=1 Tax=Xenorhabdus hominickii TaxID=351679 RepID=A0A2G0Q1L5_XENHO|nr:hypothetical protein [Xenorhabdus hominickii]PHM53106.1 transposase [Xenorhabdus hominickii]